MRPLRSVVPSPVVYACAVLGLACCKKPGPVQAQQGTLAVDDGTKDVTGRADDFGSVCVGSTAQKTLSIANNSLVDIAVSAVTVTGAGFSATPPPVPFTVAAAGSVPLPVTFSPSQAGQPAAGQLVVHSDAQNATVTVDLTGTGGTGPSQPSYAATCNFEDNGVAQSQPAGCNVLLWQGVIVGGHQDDTLQISDEGCPPLSITQVTIASADGGSGPFSLPDVPPLPATVSPSSPLTLTVRYTPTVAGSFDLATLTIVTDDPVGALPVGGTPGTFVYNLTGAGVGSDIQIAPTSYDFGAVPQGQTASTTFTVTNSGGLPLTLDAPALADGTHYAIGAAWTSGTVLAPLGAGDGGSDSAQCTVVFTSPGTGVYQDQLLVSYNSGEGSGQAVAALTAHAAGQLCANPDPLLLPAVGYCGTVQGTLVLANCGNAALGIDGVGFADGGNPGGTFAVSLPAGTTLPASVPADGGLVLTVTYQDDGHFTDPKATLLVQSDDPFAPDGGTRIELLANANAVPLPGDNPVQLADAGVGIGVTTPFVASPGTDAPLYAYAWLMVAPANSKSAAFTSDGGMAWLTPDVSGNYDVCLGEYEQALPDGGGDCGFDAGPRSHCTPVNVPN